MYFIGIKESERTSNKLMLKQQNLCCEKDKTNINQKVSLYC